MKNIFEKIRIKIVSLNKEEIKEKLNELYSRFNEIPVVQKLIAKTKNNKIVIKAVYKFKNLEWFEKIYVLVGLSGLIVFVLAPYSLLYRNTETIILEAEKRGEDLTRLLAASNQSAFTQNQEVLYSVESVIHELGVENAVITDTKATILSPVERFGEAFTDISELSNANSCTRKISGLDYEFVCPIFKWVDTKDSFVKKIMGFAYIQFNAKDSLNMASSRLFQTFKFIFYFFIIFGITAYVIIYITREALVNFKFEVRALVRGNNQELKHPEHFNELKEIAVEINELRKKTKYMEPSPALSNENILEIFKKQGQVSSNEIMLLDSGGHVLFVTHPLKDTIKISENQHILRAADNSEYKDKLIDYFSKFNDSGENHYDDQINGIGILKGTKLNLNQNNYYLVNIEKR